MVGPLDFQHPRFPELLSLLTTPPASARLRAADLFDMGVALAKVLPGFHAGVTDTPLTVPVAVYPHTYMFDTWRVPGWPHGASAPPQKPLSTAAPEIAEGDVATIQRLLLTVCRAEAFDDRYRDTLDSLDLHPLISVDIGGLLDTLVVMKTLPSDAEKTRLLDERLRLSRLAELSREVACKACLGPCGLLATHAESAGPSGGQVSTHDRSPQGPEQATLATAARKSCSAFSATPDDSQMGVHVPEPVQGDVWGAADAVASPEHFADERQMNVYPETLPEPPTEGELPRAQSFSGSDCEGEILSATVTHTVLLYFPLNEIAIFA